MTEKQILMALSEIYHGTSHPFMNLSDDEAEEVGLWLDERIATAEALDEVVRTDQADEAGE